MKKFWVVMVILLGLIATNPENSKALSCFGESVPTVGVVKSIEDKGDYFDVRSEKVHYFSENEFGNQNNINIEKYIEIGSKYVKNGYSLNQKVDLKKYPLADSHTVVNIRLVKEQIKVGDIIINGPPSSGCGYSFIGIFSGDGRLKFSEGKGTDKYIYRGKKLSLVQGKIIECDSTRRECATQVKVTYGGEEYIIEPGNSQSFINNSGFKSVYLVSSFVPEPPKNPNPNKIDMDLSGINRVSFVFLFDTDTTATAKHLNLFQRFWVWIRDWK